jgi:sporulation integral membrane protein YlbJ
MIKFNNKILKIILLLTCLICIFLFQKSNYLSIKNTITLFIESVIPSLFPFILFTNILILSDISSYINNIFKKNGNLIYVGIIGFFCGYPMGAKATNTLYAENKITKKEATFLMTFANNCNPIFIISTIGICVLDNIYLGILLAFCHYLAALIICIINFKHNDIIHETQQKSNSFKQNIDKKLHKSMFEILDLSIKSTFVTLGNILAFIIIFNLLFSILETILLKLNLSNNIIYTLSGIFEVTKGAKLIYLNTSFNFNIMISILSFMLSFSGFSIIFQIYSCVYKIPIKLWHIVKYKLIQGLISGILTYILLNIHTFDNIKEINLMYFNNAVYFVILVCILFISIFSIKKVTRK